MHADKEGEIGFIAAIGPFAAPPPTKYERLVARAKEVPAARTIVVHPCDETSLRGPVVQVMNQSNVPCYHHCQQDRSVRDGQLWQSPPTHAIQRNEVRMQEPTTGPRAGSRLIRIQSASFSILPNGTLDWRGLQSCGKNRASDRRSCWRRSSAGPLGARLPAGGVCR